MTAIFVTGTDTDVGKTFISAVLCKAWGASYWKPIQTGLNCDPGDTKTVTKHIDGVKTYQPTLELQKPLSPWRACVLEGEPELKLEQFQLPKNVQGPLIVEGAGGVWVPLTDKLITTDLVKHLDLPVVVVARSELGTLNHTLLTLEHLKSRGVKVLGVVLNGDINDDNCEALKLFGANILCQIPRARSVDEVSALVPKLEDVLMM